MHACMQIMHNNNYWCTRIHWPQVCKPDLHTKAVHEYFLHGSQPACKTSSTLGTLKFIITLITTIKLFYNHRPNINTITISHHVQWNNHMQIESIASSLHHQTPHPRLD